MNDVCSKSVLLLLSISSIARGGRRRSHAKLPTPPCGKLSFLMRHSARTHALSILTRCVTGSQCPPFHRLPLNYMHVPDLAEPQREIHSQSTRSESFVTNDPIAITFASASATATATVEMLKEQLYTLRTNIEYRHRPRRPNNE